MRKIILLLIVVSFVSFGVYKYKHMNSFSTASLEGTYEKADGVITVTNLGQNTVKVEGNATWEGAHSVNSGIIDGTVVIGGDKGVYKEKDGECQVELTFSENKLIAKDNFLCGGLNVTFTGEYKKK